MAATFVNVDLEIVASEPLDYLCCELMEHEARKLFCGDHGGGKYLATFEYNQLPTSDPDGLINSFCQMIENLDERATATWKNAHSRTFDIGYCADAELGSFRSELKPETIQLIANVGASLIVTIYPDRENIEG